MSANDPNIGSINAGGVAVTSLTIYHDADDDGAGDVGDGHVVRRLTFHTSTTYTAMICVRSVIRIFILIALAVKLSSSSTVEETDGESGAGCGEGAAVA